MRLLLLGLELVPQSGHPSLNAVVDRLAIFEDLGAERLLALAAATTVSDTAIGSKRRQKQTHKYKTRTSADSERRGPRRSDAARQGLEAAGPYLTVCLYCEEGWDAWPTPSPRLCTAPVRAELGQLLRCFRNYLLTALRASMRPAP